MLNPYTNFKLVRKENGWTFECPVCGKIDPYRGDDYHIIYKIYENHLRIDHQIYRSDFDGDTDFDED